MSRLQKELKVYRIIWVWNVLRYLILTLAFSRILTFGVTTASNLIVRGHKLQGLWTSFRSNSYRAHLQNLSTMFEIHGSNLAYVLPMNFIQFLVSPKVLTSNQRKVETHKKILIDLSLFFFNMIMCTATSAQNELHPVNFFLMFLAVILLNRNLTSNYSLLIGFMLSTFYRLFLVSDYILITGLNYNMSTDMLFSTITVRSYWVFLLIPLTYILRNSVYRAFLTFSISCSLPSLAIYANLTQIRPFTIGFNAFVGVYLLALLTVESYTLLGKKLEQIFLRSSTPVDNSSELFAYNNIYLLYILTTIFKIAFCIMYYPFLLNPLSVLVDGHISTFKALYFLFVYSIIIGFLKVLTEYVMYQCVYYFFIVKLRKGRRVNIQELNQHRDTVTYYNNLRFSTIPLTGSINLLKGKYNLSLTFLVWFLILNAVPFLTGAIKRLEEEPKI